MEPQSPSELTRESIIRQAEERGRARALERFNRILEDEFKKQGSTWEKLIRQKIIRRIRGRLEKGA